LSARPRVYVTRHLPGGTLDVLRAQCELEVWEGDDPPPSQRLREGAARAHGILTLLTDRIDSALLGAAPNLVVVSNMATGFDNIDVEAASRHSVLVTRTPGVLSQTTADLAFGLILAAARRIVEADRYVRNGRWKSWGPEVLLGGDVHGATVGIVGMGGIGSEMAKRARGFGMRIVYSGPSPKPALERRYRMMYLPLESLLREADFVSLHAPLTADTRHLINEDSLRLMKHSAVLINTARGPLVDQGALYRALKEGWIGAASLDVTDPEPMSPNDPLLTLDNIVVTPHIASASVATRSRMALLAAEQLLQGLCGETPEFAVNREILAAWRRRVREGLP